LDETKGKERTNSGAKSHTSCRSRHRASGSWCGLAGGIKVVELSNARKKALKALG